MMICMHPWLIRSLMSPDAMSFLQGYVCFPCLFSVTFTAVMDAVETPHNLTMINSSG